MSEQKLCWWHRYGVPARASRRFYSPGCMKCEEKLAKGIVSKDDPTPAEDHKRHRLKPRFGVGVR